MEVKGWVAFRLPVSMLGRLLLHVIDYQNGRRSLLQLQLQSQLLTDGVREGNRDISGIRPAAGLARTRKAVLQNAVSAKTQCEIVGAGQAGLIKHSRVYVSINPSWQLFGELRHRYVAAGKQPREQRVRDSWIFAIVTGPFIATGARGRVGFRHLRLNRK